MDEFESNFWRQFGMMAPLAILLNLAFLAGGVWVVVKVLQHMGVL